MDYSAFFMSLVRVWLFIGISASYLPGAIANVVRADGLSSLLSWSRVKTAWFSAFWNYAGCEIRKGNGDRLVALLSGRITQGAVVDQPKAPPVSGIVLDIGPGVGFWVDLFTAFNTADERTTRSHKGQSGGLKIYGIEPSADAHPPLKKRIAAAGLDDVYEILPVGIQSIADYAEKIDPGTVDCVVTFLCLCSIPEPEKNIQELYKLLKSGGRWYVFEHVRAKRSVFIQIYQRFMNLFWPHFIGGCQLCRTTESSLRNAGPWTTIDLAQPVEEPWYQVVPHVCGTLTK